MRQTLRESLRNIKLKCHSITKATFSYFSHIQSNLNFVCRGVDPLQRSTIAHQTWRLAYRSFFNFLAARHRDSDSSASRILENGMPLCSYGLGACLSFCLYYCYCIIVLVLYCISIIVQIQLRWFFFSGSLSSLSLALFLTEPR